LLGIESAWSFQPPVRTPLPNLDVRQDQNQFCVPVPAAKAAAAARLRQAVGGARIDFDKISCGPKWVASPDRFLSGPDGKGIAPGSLAAVGFQDPHYLTKAFIHENKELFGHGPEPLGTALIRRDYITPHNGLRTVVWEQRLDGISVFEAVLISHTTRKGELVGIGSTFLADLEGAAKAGTPNRAALVATPAISARRGVVLAAQSLAETVQEENVLQRTLPNGPEQQQQLQAPGLSGDVDARLIWLPMNADVIRLCWDLTLTSKARGEMFRVLVDAQTGNVLLRRCLTAYLSDATYRVFTSDSPSPFSPGHATPLTNQPALVPRALITLPALDTNASPNGWIDDGVNETRGNNVDSHTDRNSDNSPDLPRPQGSPFRVFDFAMDLTTQDPTNYSAAAVVQLFYLCNWYHDKLYDLGFTEGAGNFQTTNFGRGGLGNDAVQADAQDGSGTDNANFSTPADGQAGRMQMYIFTGPRPRRDGDLDAEIVFHEHTHGLSWRLVGGGQGLGSLQSDGMGEGWSDFYGMTLLSEAGDDVNGNYASGGYASHQVSSGYFQNYYFGIRRYPYTTDMTKNPLTFKDIDPTQADYCSSGAPYSPVGFLNPCSASSPSEVHNQGEVWCVTLWEARAALINRHGWAVGNRLILQLVTDGMKLTPLHPNFLQARDAILQADLVDTGGANRLDLWSAFARRGMGSGATSPASSTTSGVHESFDVPDNLSVTPASGFTARGPVGGPFSPSVQSFTLSNSATNYLNWSAANTNAWLTVSPMTGIISGGGSMPVTVSLNETAASYPLGIYRGAIVFSNLNTTVVQSRQFTLQSGQLDYFTEIFTNASNDLDNETLTFTPNGSTNFYAACREAALSFPTDPTAGLALSLTNHSYLQLTLPPGTNISIYGIQTNVFFLGSGGFVNLFSGDSTVPESLANHFRLPRVSGLMAHLHPQDGGAVSWQVLSNRVAVSWLHVPEYSTLYTNNFQMELFFDGRIRITHLAIGTTGGLAGLSRGAGVPADFLNSDLDSYGDCALPLRLTVPAGATEGDGVLAQLGMISLLTATTTNLAVSLSSSDTNKLTVPASVIILAGQTNATFDLTIVDNAFVDGTQTATITGSATGYANGSATIAVNDNETAALQLTLPATVGEGVGTTQGVVIVSLPVAANVAVRLSSSDPARLQVPVAVVIPNGQTTAVFTATIVDNNLIEGPQQTTLTAHVQNWTDGLATLTVLDNEPHALFVTLPPAASESAGVLNGAGRVSLVGLLPTNLMISLFSSDPVSLQVPATVTIPAGSAFTNFNLTLMDNSLVDGTRLVTVTASGVGLTDGAASTSVLDDESPPPPANPSPAHLASNVAQTNDLAWQSSAAPGQIITNDVYFGINPTPGPGEFLGSTTNTQWALPTLAPLTTYYWQVIARRVGVTPGPVWQFTTKGLDHFQWSAVSTPQTVAAPFSTTITARDEFGGVVSNFTGNVNLQAGTGSANPTSTLVISELDTDDTDAAEFANASGQPLDISGWKITVYDWNTWPAPELTFVIPSNTVCPAGGVFLLTESTPYPGVYPVFNTGSNIYWNNQVTNNPIALLVRDQAGKIVDFVCAVDANPAQITNPISIPTNQWSGNPMAANSNTNLTYQRVGNSDHQRSSDWVVAQPSLGQVNTNLVLPFAGASQPVAVTPTNSGNFTNGSWTGAITVLQPATNIYLTATDPEGHSGKSNPFDVLLQNDLAVSIADSPDPVAVGNNLANQITVVNSGPASATSVTLTNLLPAGIAFLSVSASQGSCVNNAGIVRCDLGTLAGGASVTVTVLSLPTVAGVFTNWVQVGRGEIDGYDANNIASSVTSVLMPSLSISDTVIWEGNSGVTNAYFQVLLQPSTMQTVTVAYATSDGTATAGSDYTAATGVLQFLPGQTNQLITVLITGDTNAEPNETFFVNLSAAINATLGDAQAVGTILDDDSPTVAVFDNPLYVDTSGGTNAESDNVQASLASLGFQVVTFTNILAATAGNSILLFPEFEVRSLAPDLTGAERAALSNFVASGGLIIIHGSGPNAGTFLNTVFNLAVLESSQSGGGTIFSRTAAAAGTAFAGGPATITGNNGQITLSRTSLPAGSLSLYENGNQSAVVEMFVGNGRIIYLGWDWYNAVPLGSQNGGWLTVLQSAVLERGPAPPTPPVIWAQPTNQSAAVGGTASFSVGVSGSIPLSFQWRFNGADLVNATNATLLLTAVATNQAGPYSVAVANAYGAVTSAVATLTVILPGNGIFDDFEPGIDLTQWSAFGGTVSSTVLATNYGGSVSGVNSLWFGDGGSRFATTVPVNTTSGGTISFWLRIAGGGAPPWEKADLPGEGIVLEYSVNNGASWSNLGTYDTDNYTNWTWVQMAIPAGAQAASATFRLRQLSNSGTCCDHWALDDVAVVTGPQPPAITSQPQSQTIPVGGTANFSVGVSGTMPLSFQWRFGGVDLASATNGTLVLTPVSTNEGGPYSVVVANAYGAVTSAVATLTVILPGNGIFDDFEPGIDLTQWSAFGGTVGSTILATNYGGSVSGVNSLWFGDGGSRFATTIPVNTIIGGTISFWLRIAGGGASPWEKADLPGEGIVLEYSVNNGASWGNLGTYDTDNYTNWTWVQMAIPAGAQAASANFRWRQLSNSGTCCDHWALDDVAVATGPQPPVILLQPQNRTALTGASVTFSVTATGTAPLFYQWRKESAAIFGATNASYTIFGAQTNDAGNYSVIVSNSLASINSSNAMLTIQTNSGSVVGYFTDNSAADTGMNPPVLLAGLLPVHIYDIATQDLSGLSILAINEADNSFLSSPMAGKLANIETWVRDGGRLIVHDRSAGNLNPNPFLLGLQGSNAVRLTTSDVDVIPPSDTLVTTGPFGLINNTTLDGGGSSAHGYVPTAVPLAGMRPILSIGGNSNQVVAFSYPLGAGHVYYASIPLDCYLAGAGCTGNVIAVALQTIYVPNLLKYVESLAMGSSAPAIVIQPSNQSVTAGSSVTFNVSATGTYPLSYFWRRNGAPIAGAIQSSYTTNNVQLADSGAQFSCVVTNAYGSATSQVAILTVTPVPVDHFSWSTIGASQSVNLPFAARITALDAANTVVTNFTGTVRLSGTAGASDNFDRTDSPNLGLNWTVESGAWRIESNQARTSAGVSYDVALFNFATTNGVVAADVFYVGAARVTYCALMPGFASLADNVFVKVQDYNISGAFNKVFFYYGNNVGPWPGMTGGSFGVLVTPFTQARLTLRLSGDTVTLEIDRNFDGVPEDVITRGGIPLPNLGPGLALGGYNDASFDNFSVGSGATRGVAIYPTNSGNFVNGVWNGNITVFEPAGNLVLRADDDAGHTGQSNPFAVATNNPISQILFLNDRGGASPFALALSNLALPFQFFDLAHVADFSAAVSNANPASTLVIADAPASTHDFTNLAAFVNAGGRALLEYYYLQGAPYLAASFQVSTVQNLTTALPVYDWGNSTLFNGLSSPLSLSDTFADDGDKLQPASGAQAVAGFVSGSTTNQAAIVIGNGGRTIVNGFLFEEITASANATQLAMNEIQLLSGTLLTAPAITLQPFNQTVLTGGTATFSVTASGTAPLSYFWRQNGTFIPGATQSNYTISNVQTNNAGNYSVVITNAYGSATSVVAVLSVLPTTVDPGFDPGADSSVYSIVQQADGRIVAGGDFTNLAAQARSGLGRLNPDGTLDPSFNPGASSDTFAYPNVYCLAVQPDGKILVGGAFSKLGGQGRAGLGRLSPDGTLDSSFDPGAAGNRVYCLALQADGKIVVGGFFSTLAGQARASLGRLNPDGTLDASFNPGANIIFIYALAVQSDGKILVGGDFTALNGQSRANIGRFNADGTLDTSFNPGAGLYVYSLALQSDGKILVGGPMSVLGGQSCTNIGRLNLDGTRDMTFKGGANAYVEALAVQADGKILLGGEFTTLGGQSRTHLGRLNVDGTLDITFNPALTGTLYGLAIQTDGKVLVEGFFTSLGGQSRKNIGRLNNTDPAAQSLALAGSTLTWSRGGSSPEVWRTTFESTLNGTNWTTLGAGLRIAGGWQLSGAALPPNASVRARGYVSGGRNNGSSWFVETVMGPAAVSSRSVTFTNGQCSFYVSGPAGQVVVFQASSNLQTWFPVQTNTLGATPLYFIDPQYPVADHRFYRIVLH